MQKFCTELQNTQKEQWYQNAKEGLKLAQELYMRCREYLDDDAKVLREIEHLLGAYKPGGIHEFIKYYGDFEVLERNLDLKLCHFSQVVRNQMLVFTDPNGYYGADLKALFRNINSIEQILNSQ